MTKNENILILKMLIVTSLPWKKVALLNLGFPLEIQLCLQRNIDEPKVQRQKLCNQVL